MRLVLAVIFVGITMITAVIALGDAVFQRQVEGQTAASRIGPTFAWPDAVAASDPDSAMQILSDAAAATGSNVVRTSVGATDSGRTQIVHHLYLEQESTRLYEGFTLADGRWLDRTESRVGSVTVSSALPLGTGNVGIPTVLADGYDVTFAPLRTAFDSLPVAGRYVVESVDPAAASRFLEIVTRRLVEAGMTGLVVEDLETDEIRAAPRSGANLLPLLYLLIAIAAVVMSYFLLRQGKSIGVMRLLGWSGGRIWYRSVGRLQLVATTAGVLACVVAMIAVPGADAALAWSLARAVLAMALTTFGVTLIAGLVVISRVQAGDLLKGRSLFGRGVTGTIISIKILCGVLLGVSFLQVWQQSAELADRQRVADNWSGIRDYAVFFPRAAGEDIAELSSGANSSTIAEARDLYPLLDEAGAIFVDAHRYEPGVPADLRPSLVPSILVNTNFLDRYPVLDESGSPVLVDRDEQAWVVAVPQQFKSREVEIAAHFRATRIGGQGIDGAVQAEQQVVGTVPDRFRDQQVRIIWTSSGQEVFSFNSRIDPDRGNVIVDPFIEIMTPANSLTVDRFNSITGEINTPLKVRVDGSSTSVLRELTPSLESLGLDDNLRYLVTADEAAIREFDAVRVAIVWTGVAAGAALLTVVALAGSLATILSDQLRRAITVRRLHGTGFVRTYRELLTVLGVTWVGQVLLAILIALLQGAVSGQGSVADANFLVQVSQLLVIFAAVMMVEAFFVAAMTTALERRGAAESLKEL